MVARGSWAAELGRIRAQAASAWRFMPPGGRWAILGAATATAGVGYLTAAIPLILGWLVDQMLAHRIRALGDASGALGLLAGAYLAREALQVGRRILVEGAVTAIARDATVAAVGRLLRADLTTLAAERVGAINGRLNRSVMGLTRLLKLAFLDFLPAGSGALFALMAALHKDWRMGLLMAGVAPVGFLVILTQLTSQRGVRLDLLRGREALDGAVVEQLGGLESVRAANAEGREIAKVAAVAGEFRRREFRHHIAMAGFDAVKSLNEGLFHVLVIVFALSLALSGSVSAGGVLAFSMLFLAVMTPLREVHRILDEAHESALQAEGFFAILAEPPDASFDTQGPNVIDLKTAPLIEAQGLGVRYALPDGGGRDALTDLSLTIRRGERVGLAGPSGSGKTTFVRTLLRLVHPHAGILRIGGVEIHAITREAIGHSIGFVSQTPFLFSGTIRENIANGSAAADAASIARAAALAGIDAEIDALPDGYEHRLTERGTNLSGGQRQRIALARVFYQDPPILILDEATAALDAANERKVMAALNRLVEGRTVLMIAHRLTTLEQCDRILVFAGGRLVEAGSFEHLAAAGGPFAKLLSSQPRGENPGVPIAAE